MNADQKVVRTPPPAPFYINVNRDNCSLLSIIPYAIMVNSCFVLMIDDKIA
jgi:hypothetical protein